MCPSTIPQKVLLVSEHVLIGKKGFEALLFLEDKKKNLPKIPHRVQRESKFWERGGEEKQNLSLYLKAISRIYELAFPFSQFYPSMWFQVR